MVSARFRGSPETREIGNPLDNLGLPIVKSNDVNVLDAEKILPRDLAQYNAYQKSLSSLSVSR